MIAGVIVGLTAPSTPTSRLLRDGVRQPDQDMIAPVIFCTIVLGIGSVRKAAAVGRSAGWLYLLCRWRSGSGLIVRPNLLSQVGICTLGLVRSEAAQVAARLLVTRRSGFIQQVIPGRSPSY